MRLVFTTALIVSFASLPVLAQRIQNVNATVIKDKVVITYDIAEASEGQKFRLQLYASTNNFTSPLVHVTGDVGPMVSPGQHRRIEWDAKSELNDFTGDVTFEIRGEVIAPPLSFAGGTVGSKFKRGKTMEIKWKGGKVGESISLELLKGGQSIFPIGNITNYGTHSWTIPKSTQKGSDYQIKLTGETGTLLSNSFIIKKKSNVLLKMLPLLLAGGAAAYLMQPDEPVDPPINGLPSPPEPN
jgi:hypothetical protein